MVSHWCNISIPLKTIELYKAHTPHTASSIWLRLYSSNVCWWPLPIILGHAVIYVHVQKAHGPLSRCGRQAWAKMQHSWLVSNDLKHTEASFFGDSNWSVFLQVAQVPRSSKVAIFMPMMTTDIQTDCFTCTSCTCVRDKYMSPLGSQPKFGTPPPTQTVTYTHKLPFTTIPQKYPSCELL